MCKGCPCEEVAKSTVIELMTELSKKGIETDFLYEKDGQNGYWLEIVKVGDDKNGDKTNYIQGSKQICK